MKNKVFVSFLFSTLCFSFESHSLLEDIRVAKKIELEESAKELPIIYNYEGLGGYFNMPSARSAKPGVFGGRFVHLPPYQNFNITLTLFHFLELSGTYHLFRGVPDTFLGASFGNVADRSANIKLVFLRPEDSNYRLPGLAIGLNDCLGTKAFRSDWVVASFLSPFWNTEISLGYGRKRIKGLFGGIAITPFRKLKTTFLKGLTLVAEYDAIDYRNPTFEPSPLGREVNYRINFGLHYSLLDSFHFSLSSIRGKELAIGGGITTNLGDFKGLSTKFNDNLATKIPKVYHPIGRVRTYEMMVQELVKAFNRQGIATFQVGIQIHEENKKWLYLQLRNYKWRNHNVAKEKIESVLFKLIPENIDRVIVQLESETIPVVQYSYPYIVLRRFKEKPASSYELGLIIKNEDISYPSKKNGYRELWKSNKSRLDITYKPFARLFYGSASGKVKYDSSFAFGPCGYIRNSIYYKVMVGFHLANDLKSVSGVDKVNPSQLINVRSDSTLFYKNKNPYLERAYLQKNFSFTKGWFGRVSVGYFEIAYAGIASEILYYPATSNFAFGVEAATVKKRAYSGLKLENHIRKFTGFNPSFVPFLGLQYFANIYFDCKKLSTEFHLRLGRFLAKDIGGVLKLSHYFPSGTALSFWYGITSAKDIVNKKRYNEIGASISIPLDFFLPISSKIRFGSGGSAWLRDVAAVAENGRPLFKIIQDERSNQ